MQDRKLFLVAFVISCFVMKVTAEAVHEVCGHGAFVLLFGGKITGLHVSFLWPYDFSHINWHIPTMVNSTQMAWIYWGGILVGLCLSFFIQAFLLLGKKSVQYAAMLLFWLGFWTLVNSTGYLMIGGLFPFGDVYELIALGVLTSSLSLKIGLIFFFMGFVALSRILRKMLSEIFSPKKAQWGTSFFWSIIPMLVTVMLASSERDLPLVYLVLAFAPVVVSFLLEHYLVLTEQKANENPNDVAK